MIFTNKSDSAQALTALAIFIFATAIVLLYGGASAGDDTFIYMRYVQNALAGNGFTFNPGEPSYGCTSALWVFVMKPIAIIAGNHVWTWKITSSIVFGLRASVLYLFVSRFRLSTAWALFLTFVVIVEPHSFRWASSGMENSLAILLLTIAGYLFWLCAEEVSAVRIIALAVVLGTLPFARPEFATISLAISLFSLLAIKSFRFVAVLYVIELLVFALLSGFVWFCFGALIPQSAAAKAIFLGGDYRSYALVQCGKIVLTGCICPLIVLILTKGISNGAKYWRLATIICFAFAIAYLGYRNHLVSTRYASYICAPIALAAVIVIAETVAATTKQLLYIKALLVAHIVISIAVLVYLFPATRAADYKDIKNVADSVVAKTDQNARIAISEIGAFAFYSNRYIIDLDGLTDRETLSWAEQHGNPMGAGGLEGLLIARGATHFIDTRAENVQTTIIGKRLNFTLILEVPVSRDILDSGKPFKTTWRVYEVTPK